MPSIKPPGSQAAPESQREARARYLKPAPSPAEVLVPARMINESLYCKRLMYLEWVQGEWAENYFTVDGARVHRRADRAKPLKPLKPAANPSSGTEVADESGEERPYQARSVWLSSEALGLTAKVDVIDVEGNAVLPIEYKRGKRPDVPEGAWLPERAQLAAQVLLLREHGYRCQEGAIYFAADKQRVPIAIDDELIATVQSAVVEARELAQSQQIPPPLVDSPKCRGCSLVGICLPDETHLLAQEAATAATAEVREAERPRRMYAARDERLPLYVQEQGARVRLSGERLKVESAAGEPVEARLANTSQVSLYGNVQVSTQALRELMVRAIPVAFFTTGGWLVGRAGSLDSKNIDLKLAQYQATTNPELCLSIARGLVGSKILNCRTILRRNCAEPDAVALSSLKQLGRKATEAESLTSLLGIEGSAARTYFQQFDKLLKPSEGQLPFSMQGRNRRPPRDPVNALLSFCYSLLTKEVVLAVAHVGLDPMLGFYHRPRFGRPGLALDLMEEFRPIVADSVVFGAINNGVILPGDFVHAAGSVSLRPAARRRLILAFERRMSQLVTHPVFDYRVSYRRVLELQARLLTRHLLGEIESYPSFRTR